MFEKGNQNDVYVGRTKRSLATRLGEHRCDVKRSSSKFHLRMREKGPEKFVIQLLEETDRGEPDAAYAEKWWIEKLGASLNTLRLDSVIL